MGRCAIDGKKIIDLGNLFSKYKTYPKNDYKMDSPIRVFQKNFPLDYFGNEVDILLNQQNYDHHIRGADLPYWTENFFSSSNRSMIIAQDSKSEMAGSVVFLAHLMRYMENEEEYNEHIEQFNNIYSKFRFSSYINIKNVFKKWNIQNYYVTDAYKVYKSKKKFDTGKCKSILYGEIEICNPNRIILLGNKPFDLLRSEYTTISINPVPFIFCPFPIGQGRTQKDFNKKMKKATEAILKG